MIARFPDAMGLHQLEQLFALKYNAPQMFFRAEHNAKVRKINIGIDFTSSKWSLLQRHSNQLSGYYNIEIHDLRDDFDLFGHYINHNIKPPMSAVPIAQANKEPTTSSDQNPLTQFEQSLKAANALIICHPAEQKLAPSETTGFIRLLSDIGVGRFGEFETIIIAFTKYERLFAKYGVKAFNLATDPITILKTMHKTVLEDHALETGLRALSSHEKDTPHLYAMPISSFGFLRHNGAPNFDKLTGQPIAALAPRLENTHHENPLDAAKPRIKLAGITIPISTKNRNIEELKAPPHPSKHWLPFLTADPFLTAMSGIPSQFMIPFGNFVSAIDSGIPLEQWRKTA